MQEAQRNILDLSDQITAIAVEPPGVIARVQTQALLINFNVGGVNNTLTVKEPVQFIQSPPGGQPRIEGLGINIRFTNGVEIHNQGNQNAEADVDAHMADYFENVNLQNPPAVQQGLFHPGIGDLYPPAVHQGLFHPGIGDLLPYPQAPHQNVTIRMDEGVPPHYCSVDEATEYIVHHSQTSRLTDSMVLFMLQHSNGDAVQLQRGGPGPVTGLFKYTADAFLYPRDGHTWFNSKTHSKPGAFQSKFDCTENPDDDDLLPYIVRRRYQLFPPFYPTHCVFHYRPNLFPLEPARGPNFPIISFLD